MSQQIKREIIMNEMIPYVLLSCTGVFIASIAQVMLKKATSKKYTSLFKEYFNSITLIAYIMFFCSTIFGVIAVRGIPVSMTAVLETTGYVYILIFGITIFKEKINIQKIVGLIIIITGILVYSCTV